MDSVLLCDGPVELQGVVVVADGDLWAGSYIVLENMNTGECLHPGEMRWRVATGDLSLDELRDAWVGHRYRVARATWDAPGSVWDTLGRLTKRRRRFEWLGHCEPEIVCDPRSTLRVIAGSRVAPLLRVA